jgi:hypothetical protein
MGFYFFLWKILVGNTEQNYKFYKGQQKLTTQSSELT